MKVYHLIQQWKTVFLPLLKYINTDKEDSRGQIWRILPLRQMYSENSQTQIKENEKCCYSKEANLQRTLKNEICNRRPFDL